MKASPDKFPYLSIHEPWAENPNNIWLASTLTLYRNLKSRPFPNKLSEAERKQVRQLLQGELAKNPDLVDSYTASAEDLGPLEKEFLYEHFLSSRSFQQTTTGDGFLIGKHGKVFAAFNVRDHLQLHITDTQEQLEKAWHRLVKIETALGKAHEYSYSKRFGFLTAEPDQCGTALIARLYLHVPALIHTGALHETMERLGTEEVEVTGIAGSLEEIAGDILAVSNRSTLGLSEEHILQAVRAFALKITVAEQRARKGLKESEDASVIDEVSRAYGLAIHSYQLETVEAWNTLSLLKLGHELGIVSGVDHQKLNELIFDCRRAHLVTQYSEEIEQDELAHRRAEFIHSSLTDATLNL